MPEGRQMWVEESQGIPLRSSARMARMMEMKGWGCMESVALLNWKSMEMWCLHMSYISISTISLSIDLYLSLFVHYLFVDLSTYQSTEVSVYTCASFLLACLLACLLSFFLSPSIHPSTHLSFLKLYHHSTPTYDHIWAMVHICFGNSSFNLALCHMVLGR